MENNGLCTGSMLWDRPHCNTLHNVVHTKSFIMSVRGFPWLNATQCWTELARTVTPYLFSQVPWLHRWVAFTSVQQVTNAILQADSIASNPRKGSMVMVCRPQDRFTVLHYTMERAKVDAGHDQLSLTEPLSWGIKVASPRLRPIQPRSAMQAVCYTFRICLLTLSRQMQIK